MKANRLCRPEEISLSYNGGKDCTCYLARGLKLGSPGTCDALPEEVEVSHWIWTFFTRGSPFDDNC